MAWTTGAHSPGTVDPIATLFVGGRDLIVEIKKALSLGVQRALIQAARCPVVGDII